MHSADISNPAKPWELSKKWSDRISEEFFAQGDQEALHGLPVSPGYDRASTSQAKNAMGFTDFIVMPLFVQLAQAIPSMRVAVDTLATNRARWAALYELEIGGDSRTNAAEKLKQAEGMKRRSTIFQKLTTNTASAADAADADANAANAEAPGAAEEGGAQAAAPAPSPSQPPPLPARPRRTLERSRTQLNRQVRDPYAKGACRARGTDPHGTTPCLMHRLPRPPQAGIHNSQLLQAGLIDGEVADED